MTHPRFELTLPGAYPRLHLTVTRMTIAAYSEAEARQAAAAQAGAEGSEVWLAAPCRLLTSRADLLRLLENAHAYESDLENTDYLGFEGQQRLRAVRARKTAIRRLCEAHGFLG